MSSLTFSTYSMPAAQLGGENPLPPLVPMRTPSAARNHSAGEQIDYPDRGIEHYALPYRIQDQYNRERKPRDFKVAVLENEFLRATFLLEMGGRLWSLFHKPTGRELLYVNPVFQPANLAVRDAWFAGGVEWNIGIIGHCPFTCASMFAARLQTNDGTPVLRLYEFERIRGVPFQIDFYLPEGSQFLLVRPQIMNVNDHTVPMYWWSNIAVPERQDVRIIGPADSAYRHDYDGTLKLHEVPIHNGIDITYSTNRRTASDMYMRIPQGQRPWITTLDKDGAGLIQTSTSRLYGRKAFNWGMGPGGRRWQEFLAQPGHAYIEIQAGLAPTQGVYVPMPAGAKWAWLEAYGLMQSPADKVHGKDWPTAYKTVNSALESALPAESMEEEFAKSEQWAPNAPEQVVHQGSGWGALEQMRRRETGEPALPSSTRFPEESLSDEQAPWLELLKTGIFPRRPVTDAPGAYTVQPQWRALLEKAAADPSNDHWLTWLHLGVMRFRNRDSAGAKEAWKRSLQLERSGWANRNLAVLARLEGDDAMAARLMEEAHCLLPSVAAITIECCQALLTAGRPKDVAKIVSQSSTNVRENGRVRLLMAKAAVEIDDLDALARFFENPSDIANIREQEIILSDLWFAWHEKRLARESGKAVDEGLRRRVRTEFPPPSRFDFRVSVRDMTN